MTRTSVVTLLVTGSFAYFACRLDVGSPSEEVPESKEVSETAVLVGAGDIATCTTDDDESTARLLDALPDATVFTAGDNDHDNGPGATFEACYEPTWGRHKQRTFPAIGNHDYDTGTPDPYFDYFGDRAGPRGLGYYSFDLGAWHIIVLNSHADRIGTEPGAEQEQWLREDLDAHRATRCVAAIWHHPRFYHGEWGKNSSVKPFWDALLDAGADVVVNGHFHLYERYAPQDADGNLDLENGIRQFTVGVGGKTHDSFHQARPNVEVRDNTTFGVLKLTLMSDRYRWDFVPVAGGTFSDSGSAECH